MAKSKYEYVKDWRKRNPGARREEARRYRAKHPDKVSANSKRWRERRIDERRPIEAAAARKWRKQNPEGQRKRVAAYRQRLQAKRELALGRPRPRLCELCGEPGTGRGNKPEAGICFDHCHVTGQPRGWLCDRCNKILGLVRDSTQLLKRMVRYLETNNGTINNKTPEITPFERLFWTE